jgi:hypothetical protein
LIQEIKRETGNTEKKIEINLNNFKIILPKGVSKFENYDTIVTEERLKLFSNYYLPISFSKIINKEIEKSYKTYTQDELIQKLKTELENEIINENNLQNMEIEEFLETNIENGFIEVNVICFVQKEIGTKENQN